MTAQLYNEHIHAHIYGKSSSSSCLLLMSYLLDMVSRDGDRVELGHVLTGIAENILDDANRRSGWIDVGVADHIFLQNIVLNSA